MYNDYMIPHRRRSIRLKNYNYSQAGAYFVTICVKDKNHVFGKIADNNLILNEYGKIVQQQWLWLHKQYSYLKSDEFIVMSNHVHGIVIIPAVGNGRDRSLQCKIKSLPQLIGAFKTTSSKLIHNAGFPKFQWQKSFYEHIIRDEDDLNKIREYIIFNPANWDDDDENSEKL